MRPYGQRSEPYEWLVPIGTRGKAHAFVVGGRSSLCLEAARYPSGADGWERETLQAGEPRRRRCEACARILGSNTGMREDRS